MAFLLFLPMSGTTGRAVPALLVVGIMAVFAISELLLSPIGLSVTTKLAPEAFRAQMMALYFFSVGIGTSMSGVLSGYYDPAREFAYFGITRRRRRRRRCGGVCVVPLDKPPDGGRALGACQGRCFQVVTSMRPKRLPEYVSMGTRSLACASDGQRSRVDVGG